MTIIGTYWNNEGNRFGWLSCTKYIMKKSLFPFRITFTGRLLKPDNTILSDFESGKQTQMSTNIVIFPRTAADWNPLPCSMYNSKTFKSFINCIKNV